MDIFKKLTCGAKFKRKKYITEKSIDIINNRSSNITVKQVDKELKESDKISLIKSLEKIYILRKQNKIYVYGTDIPEPISKFDDIISSSHQTLFLNLIKLGYKDLTPVQMQSLPLMIGRREILVCAPTGSGKTAAFLVPIIIHLKHHKPKGFRALIISPTRELCRQTYLFCKALTMGTKIRTHLLPKMNNPKCVKYKDQNTSFDILLTTPNRLNFLLNNTPPLINLLNIEWLIIDESDKLFEIGFRDQLTNIYQACNTSITRRAMFSATYSNQLDIWCKENLYNYVTVCIGSRNTPTDTVQQELYFAGNEAGKITGLKQLIQKGWGPPVIIFVQSKERAQQLYTRICDEKINVDVIHSDRPQIERDRIVLEFRVGKIWTLICTDLLCRGLDFKDVNLVINFDFPTTSISYIHRIGRTGRAGRTGKAITFFTHEDIPYLKPIYEIIKRSGNASDILLPEYMMSLTAPPKNLKKLLKKRAIIRPRVGSDKIYSNKDGKAKRRKSIADNNVIAGNVIKVTKASAHKGKDRTKDKIKFSKFV